MKTLKFYLIILITISFVLSQEKSFDQSIKDTENQIKELKNFINMGNNEVKKLQSQSKKTKEILALTKKNINNSNTLIKTYERQISLYNKQLSNLQTAINKNNSTISEIKKSYETRSISLYKNKNVGLSNYIFNSQSFSQMIYRLKYFNIISEINQDSVNKIKTTQIYNKQKTKEIELLMSQVESSKSSKKNEITQYSSKK